MRIAGKYHCHNHAIYTSDSRVRTDETTMPWTKNTGSGRTRSQRMDRIGLWRSQGSLTTCPYGMAMIIRLCGHGNGGMIYWRDGDVVERRTHVPTIYDHLGAFELILES